MLYQSHTNSYLFGSLELWFRLHVWHCIITFMKNMPSYSLTRLLDVASCGHCCCFFRCIPVPLFILITPPGLPRIDVFIAQLTIPLLVPDDSDGSSIPRLRVLTYTVRVLGGRGEPCRVSFAYRICIQIHGCKPCLELRAPFFSC